MIQVKAFLGDGVTRIEVTGHGRDHLTDGPEGSYLCTAVTAITQTALLGLQAYAEQHPDLMSVDIHEESTT